MDLEDRVRDAYRAAADTVHEEDILPHPKYLAWRSKRVRLLGFTRGARGARPGRHHGWLQPLAAAAAVVAVAAMSLLVPHLLQSSGQGNGASASGTTALGPKFMVLVSYPQAKIEAAATGKVTDKVTLPRGDAGWWAVAATSNGSTFVLMDDRNFFAKFYRLRLTADGKEASLKPLKSPTIAMGPSNIDQHLAVSADGRVAAYVTSAPGNHSSSAQQIVVFNMATGSTRRWFAPEIPEIQGVSLSADGDTLAFTRCPDIGCSSAWVLPTDSASGQVFARAHRVTPLLPATATENDVTSDVISADGQTLYAVTDNARTHQPSELAAYSVTSGRRIGTLMTENNAPMTEKNAHSRPSYSLPRYSYDVTADPQVSRLLFWTGRGGTATVLTPAGHVIGTIQLTAFNSKVGINSVAW